MIKFLRWCIAIVIAVSFMPVVCAIGMIANALGILISLLEKVIPNIEFVVILIYDFAERSSELYFDLISAVKPG